MAFLTATPPWPSRYANIGIQVARCALHLARHTSHFTRCEQVGVPAAIATQLMLDGRIAARGVVRPMDPAVYEPMLVLLEAEGIIMHEKRIA
jgi:saccharopine dehydrogenase-like NADP-dependent oxidoreductase